MLQFLPNDSYNSFIDVNKGCYQFWNAQFQYILKFWLDSEEEKLRIWMFGNSSIWSILF